MTYDISTLDDLRNTIKLILTEICPDAIITLQGHPGAGKTTFVKEAAALLQVKERVQSPTFNLIQSYAAHYFDDSAINVYHLDCYRLTDTDSLTDLRFAEISGNKPFYAFIEWPEKIDINLLTSGVPVYSFKIETNWSDKLQSVTHRTLISIP